MPLTEIPNSLQRLLIDTLSMMQARCPSHAAEIDRMRSAIRHQSPVLPKRFQVLADNVLRGSERDNLQEDEKRLIGRSLVALAELQETGRPGPVGRGNEYRLMVYLNADENDALRDYCDREHCSRVEALRRGLNLLTGASSA